MEKAVNAFENKYKKSAEEKILLLLLESNLARDVILKLLEKYNADYIKIKLRELRNRGVIDFTEQTILKKNMENHKKK